MRAHVDAYVGVYLAVSSTVLQMMGDAGPGAKPISHRDTRDELGMGLLEEFFDDAMH